MFFAFVNFPNGSNDPRKKTLPQQGQKVLSVASDW